MLASVSWQLDLGSCWALLQSVASGYMLVYQGVATEGWQPDPALPQADRAEVTHLQTSQFWLVSR